ncbi:phage tail tape measure protein [Acinetobacter seifertii]|uniref:phage tail tape measure protein n=1 Tax=Acinetobacter seifertii TaxID=1530123 RepID=UPI00124DFEC9|nr:phage tail tape measure protein [Acinetobacter seifertii]
MKPLNLEVIFGAKDNLSPALKHMIGSSKAATTVLDKTLKQIAKLTIDQKNIASYKKFRTELDQTTSEINRYKQVITNLKQQADIEPLTKKQTRELEKSQKALERLNSTYGRQSKQLTETVQELHKAGLSVQTLTQDESNLKDKITQTTIAYEKQKQAIERINRAQQQYQKTQAKLQSVKDIAGKGMLMAGAGIAATTVPVKLAVDFETNMLGVAKQLSGARDGAGNLTKEFYDMRQEILMLGRTLPVSNNEIARMTGEGLKMGVAKQEIIGFTKEVVKMGTAFELPYDQLAEDMGKIANMYKRPIKNISELADTINYLDDNALSSGKDIIDFMQRVGGTASMVKITDKSTAALGSTLLTLGERSETASTAINAVFSKFGAANTQSKAFKSMLNELGLEAHNVGNMMQKDAVGGILAVMDAIAKLPETSTMEKFWVPPKTSKNGKVIKPGYFAEQPKTTQIDAVATLLGAEHWDTFSKLLKNRGELEKQLQLANSSSAKGSMDREFMARMQTSQAQIELFKNSLSTLGINVGSILLPTLNSLLGSVSNIVNRFTTWTQANPQLASTLVKIAVGGIALIGTLSAIALGVATILGPFALLKMSLISFSGGIGVFSGLLKALILPIKMIGTAFLWVGRAMLANPMILAITAIVAIVAGAAYLIYKNWTPIKAFFINLWNGVKNAFNTGVSFIKGIIQSIDQTFAENPILNLLVPIIGIPRMIIANWSSITGFFSTLWTEVSTYFSTYITSIISSVTGHFNTAKNWIVGIWNSIKTVISVAWQAICALFTAISPLPYITSAFNSVFDWLGGLYNRMMSLGSNIIQGLIDGIKAGFEKLKSLWATINGWMPDFMRKTMDIHSPSRVMAGLGGHIMSGLHGGIEKAFPNLKAKFADVVSIFKPDTELLQKINVAPALGKINPAPLSSGSVSSGNYTIEGDTITININAAPGQNIQQIQSMLENMLNKREREKMARVRSSFKDQE